MIVYHLFDGSEFYTESQYNDELDKCLYKNVIDFHPRHVTRYIEEFLSNLKGVVDSVVCLGKSYNAEKIRITYSFNPDGIPAKKPPREDSDRFTISFYVTIPSTLLLKDFGEWVNHQILLSYQKPLAYLNAWYKTS